MGIQKYTADKRTTINWSSGTSTEIFIYPPQASFGKRDFLFRISTATVDTGESTFTFFEGITRHLMVLQGDLELTHLGRYSKHLKPYEQDVFSGEWPTKSKGRVTDFNLMVNQKASGSLFHKSMEADTEIKHIAGTDFSFIYFAQGNANCDEEIAVNMGDLVKVDKNTEVRILSREKCNLICIDVMLNAETP